VAACLAELGALKPGNVHKHAAGHGMEIRHFEEAAAAAAPWIANADLKLGARVLGAVEASFAATGLNTNLGIVLLCAPLAAAADTGNGPATLRARLDDVLARLDREDAAFVYRAISHAKPAGLGRVAAEDVTEAPHVTLREAMALAAGRDRIANAYVSGFSDIFDFGLSTLAAARAHAATEADAITTLHMSTLASFPDSHIARKHGLEAALEVRDLARASEPLWRPTASSSSFPGLLELDRNLKEMRLNPGTTADFVVAILYADTLITLSAANGTV
jgi:triphosphoribosyl-dephospho-CoA synthase